MLSNTLRKRQAAAFVLSMLKINAAEWRSRRLLAFAQRAPQRSAFFKRCGKAVSTPLWCDRGLNNLYYFSNGLRHLSLQG